MDTPERETAYFRGTGGTVWPMDLPLPDVMEDKLTRGQLQRVNADGTAYAEPSAAAEPQVSETRPPQSASKAEWVGYAVRVHGLSPDDAEAMTKQDLIELLGS